MYAIRSYYELALTVDGGYGYAPSDYEDEGDSGSYWNLGAKAIFGITGSVYGTVGSYNFV